MLAGYTSLGLGESLLIAVLGMCVVMTALVLLALFVKVLAALAGGIAKKPAAEGAAQVQTAGPAPVSRPQIALVPDNAAEMAAALAACLAECGVAPGGNETLAVNAQGAPSANSI